MQAEDATELEEIMRNAPCGYHALDENGLILNINNTELEWLALPREEVVGKRFLADIVFAEDKPAMLKAFESLLKGEGAGNLEIRLKRSDDSPFPVLFTASAFSGGRLSMYSTDISELKEAKTGLQRMKEYEEKYRAVIAAIPDGIVLLDNSGFITSCNPAATSILGASCLIGRKFSDIDGQFFREDGSLIPEQELPPMVTIFTGNPCRQMVMGTMKPDDGMTWISISSEILSFPESLAPSAIMVRLSDITERKKQSEALQQSYRAMKALSFRLEHAREAERTSIAREIHDELGSTLTSVKFALSWAVEKSGEKARFEEIFRGLEAAIRSVKKICTDLRPSILDDLGLLAALEWQLDQFGRKTGIRCRLTKPESEPSLPMDVATGIFRIFQETLTNVARHAEATRVRVVFWQNESEIMLTVADNGKGIDPRNLAGSKSLGILGMSERAQALGGKLSVNAAQPNGTTVSLSIPHERRSSERPSDASIP